MIRGSAMRFHLDFIARAEFRRLFGFLLTTAVQQDNDLETVKLTGICKGLCPSGRRCGYV
jgi:hypothetical protein